MIFNSIQWRLQLWYGLILLCVLAGFGFTASQLARNQQFKLVDEELQRRLGAVPLRLALRRLGQSTLGLHGAMCIEPRKLEVSPDRSEGPRPLRCAGTPRRLV